MRRGHVVVAGALVVGAACGSSASFEKRTLAPYANPFGPGTPLYAPQPRRDHPNALAAQRGKLYVALEGVEDEPGSAVAVVDLATSAVTKRVTVGSSPACVRAHPDGRHLVVCNRFSNFASVIDAETDAVVREIPVPFYTVDVAFTPDGRHAFLANRWKDSVLRWDLDADLRVTWDDYSGAPADAPVGIPVGDNPRDLAMAPDGSRLYVASPTALTLSVLDVARGVEERRVFIGGPPGGVVATGSFVFVSHTGRGTQHRPDEGYDTDFDGLPGDGTANVMFQDLQNEIAVLDPAGNLLRNYTSDTICCRDFRDVDPDHPEKGAALPPPDPWPASRLAFLPPKETWIVAGALPERMAAYGDTLLVVFSGSNEAQRFRVAEDGALTPLEKAGGLFRTGMNPTAVVVDGAAAWVSERLGEHLTVLDLGQGPGHERRVLVGDVSGGEFPATDAEIGEGVNFVTAPLTVDGDQTCVHCHRDGGNVAKPIAMPLQTSPAWGTRMVQAYRGAEDTRPWFLETAMAETNFFPVINEFARKENFCCEESDPLVWSKYPKIDDCLADKTKPGCNHVLDCQNDPPPECAARTYGSTHLLRDQHLRAGAMQVLGRDRTVGDALGSMPLGFDAVTRSLGLFLLQRPRFLPNPNSAIDSAAARRGELVYKSPETACNTCHPLPLTTVTRDFNPFGLPLRFPPVITPRKDGAGKDADRVTAGFLQTFPDAQQDDGGVRFGPSQLRGIWDRARRFYHDGRAPSLREALATPGHPALRPGERGFNETGGVLDTHGSTSGLTAEELDDLVAFLLTL